jgi:hypothetical protein
VDLLILYSCQTLQVVFILFLKYFLFKITHKCDAEVSSFVAMPQAMG